jgi:exopolysaccharide biosynthesis predicted pyruvyltransferase EpsI
MSQEVGHLDNIQLFLEHDTALSLTTEDLPVETIDQDYNLLCFRGDRESANPYIEQDVSGPIKVQDISVSTSSFTEFVNVASGSKHIYTDRLHGAILGSILKKDVTFYENSYHKSRGVYEYSLTDLPNIEFKSKGLV